MIQYLKNFGHVSFEESPLNDVDLLIFAQISYLDFYHLTANIPLSEAIRISVLTQPEELRMTVFAFQQKDNLALCRLCAASARYKALRFVDFVNHIDVQAQSQFAALTLGMPDGTKIICFRGTDNTLVGWKEDFNLAFLPEIPSQSMAVSYLEEQSAETDSLILCGHSKGGNLALYSCTECCAETQDKIRCAVSFDGPGLSRERISSEKFSRIQDRTRLVMPNGSLIGLLFEQPKNRFLVESRTLTVFQHYPFTWKTAGMDFIDCPEHTPVSSVLGESTMGLIRQLTPEIREKFVEAIYEIFSGTQDTTLNEMLSHWMENAASIAARFFRSDRETFQVFLTVLNTFLKSLWNALRSEKTE